MKPELPIESFELFATGIDHPECLAFDRNGDLWAGGEAGQIYRISPQGTVQRVATMGGFCGGLAFSPSAELFVCNPSLGIVRVNPSGEFSVFASSAGGHRLICPNYGLFDSAGNYYVTDSVFRFEIKAGGSVGPPDRYAAECGRFPDGLTLDAGGNLYVCCYASDEIWRISPAGDKTLFAWDRWAILLGSPTNMAFGGKDLDQLYVANLARTTITRAAVGRKGQPLANQK